MNKKLCAATTAFVLSLLCSCYSFERAEFHNYGPPVGERYRLPPAALDTEPPRLVPGSVRVTNPDGSPAMVVPAIVPERR